MSLRDQLMKAGLASKKDVRKANQKAKQERKQQQGSREKARLVAEREAAEAKAEREARELERLQQRKARENEREAHEHSYRVRQIILANRMGARGNTRFYHKGLDGKTLHRLQVPEKIAFKLRCGILGIAALPEDAEGGASYHIVNKRAAERLAEIAPEFLVFFVEDTQGISRPEEDFLHQQWDPSFKPHRVRESQ